MFTKITKREVYDVGQPGHHFDVKIFADERLIAHACGPNVNGTATVGFRSVADVYRVLKMPDGAISEDIVREVLWPEVIESR